MLFAVASLPADTRQRLQLVAAGQLPPPFLKAVRVLGLGGRVHLLDAPLGSVLAAADMLVDLPYRASSNPVVFDAMALGCVVFTTKNVPESSYLEEAQTGVVLPVPHVQAACNRAFLECVTAATDDAPRWRQWRENGREFACRPEHYGQIDMLMARIEAHLASTPPAAPGRWRPASWSKRKRNALAARP